MTIACYARLSHENEENSSIENQLSIMENFVQNHKDFYNAEVIKFVDNKSGISLEREEFHKLMTMVRERKIDTIIVKDLSRLSRNYLDICKLADTILPFMEVRLIAISDGYDSNFRANNGFDLAFVLKNILNEYHVIETSEKIRLVFKEKLEKGEFAHSQLPYGYVLNEERKPVIVPEKAKVIREIFRLRLKGNTTAEIAFILNKKGIKSPKNGKWTAVSVCRFFHQKAYIGLKISNKSSYDVKTKIIKQNDISKQIIHENIFPIIIDIKTWEQVQATLNGKYSKSTHRENMFSKKLYCATCGKRLSEYKTCFVCPLKEINGEKRCFKPNIPKDFLYPKILEKVQSMLKKEMSLLPKFSFSDREKIEKQIAELKSKLLDLTTDFLNEIITFSEYDLRKNSISTEILKLQNKLEIHRQNLALYSKNGRKECIFDTLKRLSNSTELSKEHLQFVEKIIVKNSENAEIILENDNPVTTICKNMKIFEN